MFSVSFAGRLSDKYDSVLTTSVESLRFLHPSISWYTKIKATIDVELC